MRTTEQSFEELLHEIEVALIEVEKYIDAAQRYVPVRKAYYEIKGIREILPKLKNKFILARGRG